MEDDKKLIEEEKAKILLVAEKSLALLSSGRMNPFDAVILVDRAVLTFIHPHERVHDKYSSWPILVREHAIDRFRERFPRFSKEISENAIEREICNLVKFGKIEKEDWSPAFEGGPSEHHIFVTSVWPEWEFIRPVCIRRINLPKKVMEVMTVEQQLPKRLVHRLSKESESITDLVSSPEQIARYAIWLRIVEEYKRECPAISYFLRQNEKGEYLAGVPLHGKKRNIYAEVSFSAILEMLVLTFNAMDLGRLSILKNHLRRIIGYYFGSEILERKESIPEMANLKVNRNEKLAGMLLMQEFIKSIKNDWFINHVF